MVEKSRKAKIIGVTGKGGSGKTAFASLMIKLLCEKYKVLAIDADCGGGLNYALGIEVEKTIGDIRKNIIDSPSDAEEMEDKPIRHVIADIVNAGKGFGLLAMGRAEGPGCYCHINDLLKYGIDSVADDFDIVLIDCEAGPEQINRRVIQKVHTLVVTVDNSLRSIQVAGVIGKLARGASATKVDNLGLVVNKYKNGKQKTNLLEAVQKLGLPLLGCIPDDARLAEYDSLGKPLLELPNDAPSVVAVREIIKNMHLE